MNHLLTINGTPITDDGRTFDESSDFRMVQNELADGSLRRYNKGAKLARQKWSFAWTWCPSKDIFTSDKKGARDTIKALVNTTSAVNVGITINGVTTTKAFFTESYSEKLIRRDIISNVDYYEVNISFVEI